MYIVATGVMTLEKNRGWRILDEDDVGWPFATLIFLGVLGKTEKSIKSFLGGLQID
jgi:hypothetical protein